MLSYDLDALGWLLFERLATDAAERELGVPASAWEGASDARREALVPHLAAFDRTGPTALGMAWVRAAGPNVRRQRLRAAVADTTSVVITNADETEAGSALRDATHVLGRRWLAGVLDRVPALRLAHPSVLVEDDLSRVFVPVRAYAAALDVLRRHGFAVLVGPPEMGKTAIARMAAVGLVSDGWEAYECTRPEQVWGAWHPDRRQVFVADDAFGSTEYRPDAAERWGREIERLVRAVDDRHWLLWTSRPAPLQAGLARIHRERGGERFPRPLDLLVDAAALDRAEKALILLRHAQAAGVAGTAAAPVVRAHADVIVEDPHFTPERIRRLATAGLLHTKADAAAPTDLAARIAEELRVPTAAMRESFAALDAEHRAVLVALLDCPPGSVRERDLTAAVRRHAGRARTRAPAELLERLTDHFVRVSGATTTWVHPSWPDLVIDHLAADAPARRAFLARAELNGILLAVSVAGGARGARRLPLMVDDGDGDIVADRIAWLAGAVDDHDALRLLTGVEAAADPEDGELRPVADRLLDVLRRRWDAEADGASVACLAAWFELASAAASEIPAPHVERTWFAVLPPAAGPLGDDDLRAADDWLWLIEVLWRHRSALLRPLGTEPNEVRVTLIREAVEAGAPGDALRTELLDALGRRLDRLRVHVARRGPPTEAASDAGAAEGRPPVPVEPFWPRTSTVARILEDL